MSTEPKAQTPSREPAGPYRSLAVRRADQRRFYVLLGCAALVHASLIIGFVTSAPRVMGERSGQPDGISVMIVDAADLESKTTVPLELGPARHDRQRRPAALADQAAKRAAAAVRGARAAQV